MHGTRALVRRPGPRLAEGEVTHLDRTPSTSTSPSSSGRATSRPCGRRLGDHRGRARPTTARTPSSSRTRSSSTGDLAVIARSGAPSRRPETVGVERVVRGPRLPGGPRSRRPAPSTAATSSSTAGRHTSASARGPTGPASTSSPRHLRALGVRGPGRAGHPGAAPQERGDRPARRDGHRLAAGRRRRRGVPARSGPSLEEPGAHVVLLGEDHLLMAASAARDRRQLRAARVRRDHRRHLRVREDGGLRHLPVGAAARADAPRAGPDRGPRRPRGGPRRAGAAYC